MKKIYFLLNHSSEFKAQSYCDKYLFDCDISHGTSLPINAQEFDLVVPWSYRKKIKNYKYNNAVVFHSSDLPEGKGWAPIFNVLNKKLKEYVVSAILLDDDVDSGNIIAKAKFKIKNTYTAEFIRKVDEEVSIKMIAGIISEFDNKSMVGVKQEKTRETYYERRYPKDNKLDINTPIKQLIPILKGCENTHPAFFEYKGDEFEITIKPRENPVFPKDLEIIYK
jgi:methionyl-tRNA formyltransferase